MVPTGFAASKAGGGCKDPPVDRVIGTCYYTDTATKEHTMSNYPNMSYCMNENTLLAMRQIVAAMQEQGADFLRDLSRDERRAFGELFNTCEDFMNLSEELQDELEQEGDGQPDEAQEWYDFDPDC
jgi:hypothetical protein